MLAGQREINQQAAQTIIPRFSWSLCDEILAINLKGYKGFQEKINTNMKELVKSVTKP